MTEPFVVWGGLSVDLWYRGGLAGQRSHGAVYIHPGEIGVRLNRRRDRTPWPTQSEAAAGDLVVRQQRGPVDVNHCLFPPWLNTAILIRDGDLRAVVKLPMWHRPGLKRGLDRAGIELRWHRQVFLTLNADPLPPRRPS